MRAKCTNPIAALCMHCTRLVQHLGDISTRVMLSIVFKRVIVRLSNIRKAYVSELHAQCLKQILCFGLLLRQVAARCNEMR